MSSAHINMASKADDPELSGLMREMPMPGTVQILYQRDPSFLDALDVCGHTNDVLTARDKTSGKVVGVGTRSVKSCYVNGQITPVGYLSNLRLKNAYRGGIILHRAFKTLKNIHQKDEGPRFYLSTVLEGNDEAEELLTSGRANLPTYHDFGNICSMAISTKQRVQVRNKTSIVIRRSSTQHLDAVLNFWNTHGKTRQFFPKYTREDVDGELLKGLEANDILVALDNGQLVGTLAIWNQQSFKQNIVTGYARWLSLLRPIYNGLASLLSYPQVPARNHRLNFAYLACTCIKNNNELVFRCLLAEALCQSKTTYDFLMASFHEKDPLLRVIKSVRHFSYPSRLYVVAWDTELAQVEALDHRVPYLELGAL